MGIIQEIKNSFRRGTVLTKLIYLNIGIFIFLHVAIAILYLSNSETLINKLLTWLAVPADLHKLALRPWTAITYMFLHKDFFHILINIAWLFWFGKIFLVYFDHRKLFNIYILGGLTGAIFYIVSYNLFPVLKLQATESIALGASASVMAIVIAISFYVPDYRINLLFLGSVRIIWIALIGFILSSLVDFSSNTGGKIAHIGGALYGYIFTLRFKKGRDITAWFSKISVFTLSLFRKNKTMKVKYKRPTGDFEYNSMKVEKQKEIDRILDKISKAGYESLTAEEKEILFKESK